MWIEQKFEGSRNQRIKLDQAPWSLESWCAKFLKHGGWLVVAFATGMTFVGYFLPDPNAGLDLASFSSGQWQVLWTLFFTCATYINAGWMREQVCLHMCPYARFQSVMFDHDTLIVSYDPSRGEPRGSRKRSADPGELGLGSCIDCELCVQVCPTGIDIRDGLQYECIGCALCVDACNSVMDKMNYERGLIRYTSEHQLEGGHTHWLRPRIIGYGLVLCLMVGVFSYHVFNRVPVELTVIRDRNQLYLTTDAGDIENIYTLHLVNMDDRNHEFRIEHKRNRGRARIIGETRHQLQGGEVRSINLRVRAEARAARSPEHRTGFRGRRLGPAGPAAPVPSQRFMKPL